MSNTTTTKKPYLANIVGRTVENDPYAFHLEGFAASNDPKFFPADGEKQARFSFSIGIRGAADELLARANGSLFGKDAEEVSKVYVKGMKIAVAGKLSLRTYDKADGSQGSSVSCAVNKHVLMESKGKPIVAKVTDAFGTVSYVYKDKTGSDRVINMAELLPGTVVGTPKSGRCPRRQGLRCRERKRHQGQGIRPQQAHHQHCGFRQKG